MIFTKKITCTIIVLFSLLIVGDLQAQGMAFGAKGGPVAAFGRGQQARNSALFALQGDLFIESLPAGNDYAVFAQAGYHTRGSASGRVFGITGGLNQSLRQLEFNNLALMYTYLHRPVLRQIRL